VNKSWGRKKITHAKAQSAAAFLKILFAPVREKCFVRETRKEIVTGE